MVTGLFSRPAGEHDQKNLCSSATVSTRGLEEDVILAALHSLPAKITRSTLALWMVGFTFANTIFSTTAHGVRVPRLEILAQANG